MSKIQLNNEQLKKIQNYETILLKEVDKICSKHNIKYSVAYGTLLGQIRHKGFIPWDDDIDIIMLREDYEKFKEICEMELPKEMFYQSHSTDKEYYYLYDKIRLNGTIFKETFLANHNINHGVFLDVFPMDYLPENKVLRNIQYLRFHFYRAILESKYINVKARHGKKKVAAIIISFVFKPLPIELVYNKCIHLSKKYNSKEKRYIRNFCDNFKNKKNIFEKEKLFDVSKDKFENIEAMRTNNYQSFLTKIYGNYMELPPLENRKTAHDLEELKL